jgi:DNA-binding PadR family transcriptional regulator
VLTGKALAKQTVAISWLVKEKKYYEITPKGVNVDRYQEISKAPSRYAVYAHVKELSRLLDDGTNKLNKETDDQYNVNYTLEKTGDHWSIYDSQLIQPSGAGAATNQAKTPATTKPKH